MEAEILVNVEVRSLTMMALYTFLISYRRGIQVSHFGAVNKGPDVMDGFTPRVAPW